MVGLPSQVEQAAEAGIDMCASGYEAGGHVDGVGTLPLMPQIVDARGVKTSSLTGGPMNVVAACGIHDGRTLSAVISLGAEDAWEEEDAGGEEEEEEHAEAKEEVR